MPIYTAPYIFNGFDFLPPNSAIEVDANGQIIAIHTHTHFKNILHLSGLLCPGFINVHCHLELSHLKGHIPTQTGLVGFINQVNTLRAQFSNDTILQHIEMAEQEMMANGIVAVGDICNTAITAHQKQKNNIYYHNFVETIGVLNENAAQRYEHSFNISQQLLPTGATTIVPHAPYSVSNSLLALINTTPNNSPICIHNQECEAENELIEKGTGLFTDFLNTITGKTLHYIPHQMSSLEYYTQFLTKLKHIIFVHNTFSSTNDIKIAQKNVQHRYWCLCANANLYIEQALPTIIYELYQHNEMVVLGTDSLASNTALSIYAEMYTLHCFFPELSHQQLLQSATYNGAKALQIEHKFGSFQVGCQPGIIQLSNWSPTVWPKDICINRII